MTDDFKRHNTPQNFTTSKMRPPIVQPKKIGERKIGETLPSTEMTALPREPSSTVLSSQANYKSKLFSSTNTRPPIVQLQKELQNSTVEMRPPIVQSKKIGESLPSTGVAERPSTTALSSQANYKSKLSSSTNTRPPIVQLQKQKELKPTLASKTATIPTPSSITRLNAMEQQSSKASNNKTKITNNNHVPVVVQHKKELKPPLGTATGAAASGITRLNSTEQLKLPSNRPPNVVRANKKEIIKPTLPSPAAGASSSGAATTSIPISATPHPESTKQSSQSQPYFKSKFWEFVDPKGKANKPAEKPRERLYDANAVKTYIEKQKEVRKEKELAEAKERQALIMKKKNQLQQLSEKAKHLAAAAVSAKAPQLIPPVPVSKSKSKSKSTKSKTAPILHSDSTPTPPTAALKASNLLLQEFETIVKRECINYFHNNEGKSIGTDPSSQQQEGTPPPPPKVLVDQGVETTDSLAELYKSALSTSLSSQKSNNDSSTSFSLVSVKVFKKTNDHDDDDDDKAKKNKGPPPTLEEYNFCASRIQAAFKGYKERKILREANLLPKDLVRTKKLFQQQTALVEKSFTVSSSSKLRGQPEKPYDSNSSESVSLVNFFKKKYAKEMVQSYIPPPMPPTIIGRARSSTTVMQGHGHNLPSTPPIGIPRSRKSFNFNEPYPKEALQRLQEAQLVEQEAVSLSRRNSFSEIRKSSLLHFPETPKLVLGSSPSLAPGGGGGHGSSFGMETTPKKSSNNVALSTRAIKPSASGEENNWGVGTGPSISTVLFEKLRLLQTQKKVTPPGSAGGENKSVSASSLASSSEPNHLHHLDKDFESISSIPQSQDVSITDDYFGPSDSEVQRHRERHTRTSTPIINAASDSNAAGSKDGGEEESMNNTNVETDEDLVDNITLTNNDGENVQDSSTSGGQGIPYPTTTSGGGGGGYSLPIPALKLKYHAEQERLAILEKAIAATTFYERHEKRQPHHQVEKVQLPKIPTTSEIQEIAKQVAEERFKVNMAELEKEKWGALIKQQELLQQKNQQQSSADAAAFPSPNSLSNLQLEMMKCHKEAAKASVEVSKWMAEMGKSLLEDRHHQRIVDERMLNQQQQQGIVNDPVNLAAIVYAAVDEAQRIVEAERRLRMERQMEEKRPKYGLFREKEQQNVGLQYPSVASVSESLVENQQREGSENFEQPSTQEEQSILPQENDDGEEEYEAASFLSEAHTESVVDEIEQQGEHNTTKSSSVHEQEDASHLLLLSVGGDESKVESVTSELEGEALEEQAASTVVTAELTNVEKIIETNIPPVALVDGSGHVDAEQEQEQSNLQESENNERNEEYEAASFLSEAHTESVADEIEQEEEHDTTKSSSLHEQDQEDASQLLLLGDNESKLESVFEVEGEALEEQAASTVVTAESINVENEKNIEPDIIKTDIPPVAWPDGSGHFDVVEQEQSIPQKSENDDEGEEEYEAASFLSEAHTESVVEEIEEEHDKTKSTSLLEQDQEDASHLLLLGDDESKVESVSELVDEALEEQAASTVTDVEKIIETDIIKPDIPPVPLMEDESGLVDVEQQQSSPSYFIPPPPYSSPPTDSLLYSKPDSPSVALMDESGHVVNEQSFASSPFDFIPPPPYSCPPIDSLLYSIHVSAHERLPQNRAIITKLVTEQVDRIWEDWNTSRELPLMPHYAGVNVEQEILSSGYIPQDDEEEEEQQQQGGEREHQEQQQQHESEEEEEDINSHQNQQGSDGIQPPDSEQVLKDQENIELYKYNLSGARALSVLYLVRDCIRECLRVDELNTPSGFVDTSRRGAYAVAALEAKVPKTREELITAVTTLVLQYQYTALEEEEEAQKEEMNIEQQQQGEDEGTERQLIEPLRNALLKWNCRIRDIVENLLVGETLEDEPQWLNIWPEALQLTDEYADKIIKDCVKEAMGNFEVAFKGLESIE